MIAGASDQAVRDRHNTNQRLRAAGLALLILILAAYAPSLSSDFVLLDDPQYVFENPLVLRPSWSGVWRFISEVRNPSTVAGYYQPLTMMSLMLDSLMTGGGRVDPAICHLHNMALHAVMSVLVMLVLREIGASLSVAFLLAALFAIHPVNVESVSWIAQRKTVLASPLAMGCLLCHLRYARAGSTSSPAPPTLRWLALALYYLSTLAKPTIVLLPIVLVLCDIWILRRPVRQSIVEKWPFTIVMGLMGMVAVISQAQSQATLGVPNLSSLEVLSKWLALLSYNLMLYLGNIVWPFYLSPLRATPNDLGFSNAIMILSVAGLGLFLASLAVAYQRAPRVFAGLAGYCILLSPAMGPVRFFDSCVADRFLYFPMVSLLMAAAGPLTALCTRSARSMRWVWAAVIGLSVPLWVVTQAQQTIWRDGKTFWTHVVESVPGYGVGHIMLALIALDDRDAGALYEHARAAVASRPFDSQAAALWGKAHLLRGQATESERILRESLTRELTPDASSVYLALAETLATQGKLVEARAACEKAIELGASWETTYLGVGETLLGWTKRFDFAVECFQKVLDRSPEHRQARWNLGTALEGVDDPAGALAAYTKALQGYEMRDVPPALREAVDRLEARLGSRSSVTTQEKAATP